MEILRVTGSLVCTVRHPRLYHSNLRLLRDVNGKIQVAVDTCHATVGDWVFVINGSAARIACGDTATVTDLTIGGIIDEWDAEMEMAEPGAAAK